MVSDGKTLLEKVSSVGDEPYLMAERLKDVPIVVSVDRFRGCQRLVEQFKVDIILLDDGFQHLRLHRDLNVLLVDATNPFGNGFLLPRCNGDHRWKTGIVKGDDIFPLRPPVREASTGKKDRIESTQKE